MIRCSGRVEMSYGENRFYWTITRNLNGSSIPHEYITVKCTRKYRTSKLAEAAMKRFARTVGWAFES